MVNVIAALDPALKCLAHEGRKRYADAFELIGRREVEAPNASWQADHTELDFYILTEDGTPARPWLTLIIDEYSRAIAAHRLSLEAPSAIGTALTLRRVIWRKGDPHWQICGIPAVFYTDHGSDFTSEHLEQVAADLKIRLVFSLPGQPRGRGKIERLFATVHQMCLSALPGYAAVGSPTRVGQARLNLAQLDEALNAWIIGDYHRRIHPETRQPPAARWAQGGFLPQMPDSLEQLDLLLLTVAKPRKVHPTASTRSACATWTPRWPRSSEKASSSATTPATSPNYGSSTATSSSAGRSAPSWPAPPSACGRSSWPAALAAASSPRIWPNAPPWSTSCSPTAPAFPRPPASSPHRHPRNAG